MIDWLSDWLQEIILVVLFAVVTDMLLPNNSMQRYIKVVVSLFILLTILSPILTLIRSDFHIREVGAELDSWSNPREQALMASQTEIEADAERLRRLNEQQTVQWVESRLAGMVKEDLVARGYNEVYEVRAKVDLQQNGQADIKEILVYLREEKLRGADSSDEGTAADQQQSPGGIANPIRPIDPVQPVVVDIDLHGSPAAPEAYPATRSVSSGLTSEIRQHIADEWGVSPEQIVFRQTAR